MGNGFLDDLPELELPGPRRRKKPKARARGQTTDDRQQTTDDDLRATSDERRATDYDGPVVRYVRVRCPKCKSPRVPVYNSDHLPIRYHKCSDCGLLFKSVEEKH